MREICTVAVIFLAHTSDLHCFRRDLVLHYQRAVSLRNEGQAFYQRRRNHSWLSKKSQIFLFPALQGNLLRVLVDSPDVLEEKSPREVEILKSKKATDPDKVLLLLASQNNRTL